ncbi:NigD1/NigD2 family lipoprotein [Bacteroides ihuae]|uniref:NigD-like protein n=1 Tax=Bacteroides ihuae TaxID=1852362 RepID=UPI00098F301A|nr:NigD-like protein [Bacteroides ihuae]
MKRLKFAIFILGLAMLPFLQSCLDDDKDGYSLAISTVKVIEGRNFYFAIDGGEKMLPGDTTNIHNYKLKDGQRAFVYFNLLEDKVSGYDYNAKIEHVENILTKGVIPLTAATADSIGDDRINVTEIWIAGGYLNLEFQILGTSSPQKLHMVNLVQNEMIDDSAEEGYINLEFRHNAYNDNPDGLGNGIVSFKIESLVLNAEKGLKIRVNTINDGVKYYKVDFPTVLKSLNVQRSGTYNALVKWIY